MSRVMALSVRNRVHAFYQRHEAALVALAWFPVGAMLLGIGMSIQAGEINSRSLLLFVGIILGVAALQIWRSYETVASALGLLIGYVVIFGLYLGAGALIEAGYSLVAPVVLVGYPVGVYFVFRGGDA